jgi:hypothetical protein
MQVGKDAHNRDTDKQGHDDVRTATLYLTDRPPRKASANKTQERGMK